MAENMCTKLVRNLDNRITNVLFILIDSNSIHTSVCY